MKNLLFYLIPDLNKGQASTADQNIIHQHHIRQELYGIHNTNV